MKNIAFRLVLIIGIINTTSVVAQWKELSYGTFQGIGLSIVEAGPNLLVGTLRGGVYYSPNGGANWMKSNFGDLPPMINSLCLKNGKVYAGTSSGLYVSVDFGINWTLKNFPNEYIDFVRPSVSSVSLLSQGKIFSSFDEGGSWQIISAPVNARLRDFIFFGSSSIIAYSELGFHVTNDGGISWSTVTKPVGSFRSLFHLNGVLMAGGNTGVYRSINGGESWVQVSPVSGGLFMNYNGDVLYASDRAIYLSNDLGATWLQIGTTNAVFFDWINSASKIFATSFGKGILASNNGQLWQQSNTGFASPFVRELVFFEGQLICSSDGGVFSKLTNGLDWKSLGLSSSFVRSTILVGSTLFTVANGNIYRSADNGLSWTLSNTGLIGSFATSVVSMGTNLFLGTTKGIYVSIDSGSTWTLIALSNIEIRKLVVTNGALFAIASSGINTSDLYKSINGGVFWKQITSLPDKQIKQITATSSRVFGAFNSGVFYSDNFGESWLETNSAFRGLNVSSMCANGTDLYLAGDNKIMKYSGGSIANLSDKSPFAFVSSISDMIVVESNLIIAVNDSYFGSIWSYSIDQVPSISSFLPEEGPGGTVVTILGQNFSAVKNENIVQFNGTYAQIKSATSTSLIVEMPRSYGVNPITLQIQGQPPISTLTNFSVQPEIYDVEPNKGTVGSLVRVLGTGFDPTSLKTLTFSTSANSSVINMTDKKINTVVPDGAVTGKISLIYKGKIYSSPKDYQVVPSVLEIRPSRGLVNSEVSLTGTGFNRIATNNIVKFNGVQANVIWASTTLIIAKVPPGNVSGKVSVEVGGNSAMAPVPFTLLPLPIKCFALPPKPSIKIETNSLTGVTRLISSSLGGNQWFEGLKMIPGSKDSTIVVSKAGFYSVQVTIDGCISPMSELITVDLVTGSEDAVADVLHLFPNPCSSFLNVMLNSNLGRVDFRIHDQLGRLVHQLSTEEKEVKLDVTDFSAGIYLLSICSAGNCEKQKFIKL